MAEGDESKGLPEVYLSPSRKFKELRTNKTFVRNYAVSTDTDVWDESDSGECKYFVPGTTFTLIEDRNIDEHSREFSENENGSHGEQSAAASKNRLDKKNPFLDDQNSWRNEKKREEFDMEMLVSAPNTPIKGFEEEGDEMKNMPQNPNTLWSQKRGETPGSDKLGVGGVTGSKVLKNSGNVGVTLLPPAQKEHMYLPEGIEGLITSGGLHADCNLESSDAEEIDWLSGQGSWSGYEVVDRDTVGVDGAPAAVYPPRSIGTSTAQMQRNSPAGLSTPDVDVDLAAQMVSSTFQGQQAARPPVMGQSEDTEQSSRRDLGSTDGEESERGATLLVPMAVVGETHSHTGIQQSPLGSLSENTDSANTVLSREEVEGCKTQVKGYTKSITSVTLSPRAGLTKPNFVVGGAISPRGQFQEIQNTVRGRMQDLKASLDIQPERDRPCVNDRENFLNNAPLFQNFVSVGEQEISLTSMISVESTQHPESSERVTSPSVLSVSSVASSKKLEWDSGADVGYAGVQPEQSSAVLSTLERIAIGSYASVLRTEPEGSIYVKDKQKFSKVPKNVSKPCSELKPEIKKTLTTKKYSDSVGSKVRRMQQSNILSSSEDNVPSRVMNSSQSPRRKPRRRSTLAEAKQDSVFRKSSKSKPQSGNRVKQVILEARREGKSSSLVELSQPPMELQEHNRSTSQQTIAGTKKIGSIVEYPNSLNRHSSLGTVTGSSVSVVTAIESCANELEKLSHDSNTITNAPSPVQESSLVLTTAPASPVKCWAKSPARTLVDAQNQCHEGIEKNTENNVSEKQIVLSSYSSFESGRNMKTSGTENLSDAKDTVDSSSSSQPTDEETIDLRCRNDVENVNVISRTVSSSSESTTQASGTSVSLSEINNSLQCLSKDLSNRIEQLINEGSFKKFDDYQKLQEYIIFIGIPSSSVEDCRLKQSIARVIMRMFMEVSNVHGTSMNMSQASSSYSCDTVEASVLSSTNGSQPSVPSTSHDQGNQHSGKLCKGEQSGQECVSSQKKCLNQEEQSSTHEKQSTSQKAQFASCEEQDPAIVCTVVVPYQPASASHTYYMAVSQEGVESGVEADCIEPSETAADWRFRNQNQQELLRGETIGVDRTLQELNSQAAEPEITASMTPSTSAFVKQQAVALDDKLPFPDREGNLVRSQVELATSRISGESGYQYEETRGIHLASNAETSEGLQDIHDQGRQDSQLDIRLEENGHQRIRDELLVDSAKEVSEAESSSDGNVEPELCSDRSVKVSEIDPNDPYDWRNQPTKSERRFYKDRHGTLHIAHQPPGYTEDGNSHPSESTSELEVASRNTGTSSVCYEAAEASRAWSSTGSESAYETIRERHRHVGEALASSFEFYSTSPREARFLEYVSVDNTQEQETRTPLTTVTSPQGIMVNMSAENSELPMSQSNSVTDTLSSPGYVWTPQSLWDSTRKGESTAFSSPSSNQRDISSQLSLIHEQKQKYFHKLQNIVPYIQQIESLELIERALQDQFRSSGSHVEGYDSNTLVSPMTQRISGTASNSIASSDFSEKDQIWSHGLGKERKKDATTKEMSTFIHHSGRSSRMNSTDFSTPSFSALKEMEEEVKKLRALTKKAVESRQNTLTHDQRNGRQSNKVFSKQSGRQQLVSGSHKEDTGVSSYAQSYDTTSSSRDKTKERIRDRRDRAKLLDTRSGHRHKSQQSLSRAFRLDTESVGYPLQDDAVSSVGDTARQSDATSTVESTSDEKIHHSSHASRQHMSVVRDVLSGEGPRIFSSEKDSVHLVTKEKGGKPSAPFDSRELADLGNGLTSSLMGQYVRSGNAALSARQLREMGPMWSRSVSTEVIEKKDNATTHDFVTSTLKKIVTGYITQREVGFGTQNDLTDTSQVRSNLANTLQGSSGIVYPHQGTIGLTDAPQGRSDLIDDLRGRSDLVGVLQSKSDPKNVPRDRGDYIDAVGGRSELPDSFQSLQNNLIGGKETYSSNRIVSSKNLYNSNGQNEADLGFTKEGQPSGGRIGTRAEQLLEENTPEREEAKNDKKDFSQMFPSFLADPNHTSQQAHSVGIQTGRSILEDSTGAKNDVSLVGKSWEKRYEQQPSKLKSKELHDERITRKGRYEKNTKFLDKKLRHGENERSSSAKESQYRTKAVVERRSSSTSRTELESGNTKEFSSSDVYVEKKSTRHISPHKTSKFKDTSRGVVTRTKHGANVQVVSGRRSHKSRRPSSAKESQHKTRIGREERSNSVSRTENISGSFEDLSSPEVWDGSVEDPTSSRRGDHTSALKEVNRPKSDKRIHKSWRPSSAKEWQQLKEARGRRSSSASGRNTGLKSESHSLSQSNSNSQLSSTSNTLESQRNKIGHKQSSKQKRWGQEKLVEPLVNKTIHARHRHKTVISEVEELRNEKRKENKRTTSRRTEETFKYATSKQHRNVRVDISYSSTSSSVEHISLVTSRESHSLLPKETAKQDPVTFSVPVGELESLSDIDPEMKTWLKENQERMKSLGIEIPKKPVLSLQEALARARPGYIRNANKRRAFLQVKKDIRKEASDLNKRVVLEMPSKMDTSPTTLKNHLYRPTIKPLFSYKEIRQQTRKIYENLPEIRNPVNVQQRKVLYHSNRVMASVYSQQLRKKVLGGKVSHAHKNIITPTRRT
ncbi:uncharacterized protein LOC143034572 isoform X2 [Oratosquilla oratoria]|uniref:uncharacterized protein LOC143034572 isoform X2 n=1 Tax=Oratosquilla oratoria TaxID=337810 RepID=UPI003F76B069